MLALEPQKAEGEQAGCSPAILGAQAVKSGGPSLQWAMASPSKRISGSGSARSASATARNSLDQSRPLRLHKRT
jgi:hypothetical protein